MQQRLDERGLAHTGVAQSRLGDDSRRDIDFVRQVDLEGDIEDGRGA
jgi:hypothetical protein